MPRVAKKISNKAHESFAKGFVLAVGLANAFSDRALAKWRDTLSPEVRDRLREVWEEVYSASVRTFQELEGKNLTQEAVKRGLQRTLRLPLRKLGIPDAQVKSLADVVAGVLIRVGGKKSK